MSGPVVLAFDTGAGVGLGHQRRMEALAAAFADLGVRSRLVDASNGATGELVVVDSYRRRADDRESYSGRVIGAVDDLERGLDVDVLVEPGPGARATGSAKRHLVGADFALLDPALARLAAAPIGRPVGELLVATGGTDTEGVGARLANALHTAVGADVHITYARGPWSAGEDPRDVEVVATDRGLNRYLARSDVVVTASGVTMLEALCLGRPVIGLVLSDNQRRQAEAAAASGAIELVDIDVAVNAAAALVQDATHRRELSAAGRRLVDGFGARRVARAIAEAL